MDCRVVVEAAVPVYDVETPDEAIRIAISKTGKMLNPDLNYVEITNAERACPHCQEELPPAFIAADESLVALQLEMKVFNVEREEHASRVARKEIGGCLENIPLEVMEVEVIETEDDDDSSDEEPVDEETAGDESADDEDAGAEADNESDTDAMSASNGESEVSTESGSDTAESGPTAEDDEEVLPEFEDLVE